MLMVGRPGTGKSMLAEMFKEVLDRSIGDILRPQDAIVAFPGKDKNHVRMAYEHPEKIDRMMEALRQALETAQTGSEEFSLEEEIRSARRIRWGLLAAAVSREARGFLPAPLAGGRLGRDGGHFHARAGEPTTGRRRKSSASPAPGCARMSSTCTT
jgi:ATP-dependent Lon protease